MKPLLKWVGGKTQIIDTILSSFPENICGYHEIFVGGGSVLLALLSNNKNIKKFYAYDNNPDLIFFYKNVQKRANKLLSFTKRLIQTFNNIRGDEVDRNPTNLLQAKTSKESFYYWVRKKYNEILPEYRHSVKASAMFLFLNKTCWRGVYRTNRNGKFNVPYGNYKNPEIINEEHLLEVSELIKNVEFTCMSFEKSIIRVKKQDFMYLDPPYAPETSTSFVSYTPDGFDRHVELFDAIKESKRRFLLSNSNVDIVRNAFQDYDVIEIECRRAINSKKPNDRATEVLIKRF